MERAIFVTKKGATKAAMNKSRAHGVTALAGLLHCRIRPATKRGEMLGYYAWYVAVGPDGCWSRHPVMEE